MCAHRVTAVVVSHNGARWIPALLAALASSTRQPDRILAVDTGSTDGSADLLAADDCVDRVVGAPSTLGFGAAVASALEQHADVARHRASPIAGPEPDDVEWIWLLHDDCAPAPTALAELLTAVCQDPDLAVAGPKLRGWPRAQRLLEVGTSIAGSGRRVTGLDAGEYDQGQHDRPQEVLGVSTAGALVRRDLWDRLGGLDPALPLFRDDVDFGWRAARAGAVVRTVPAAVVFHAEAAARGVRAVDCAPRRPHRADREGAMLVLLANARGGAVPFRWLRLLGGAVLRALGFLLGKLPGVAMDELLAAGTVLFNPARLVRVRRRRRGLSQSGPRVRALRPSWRTSYRDSVDAVLLRCTEGWQDLRGRMTSRRRPDTSREPSGRAGTGRWWAARRPVLTTTVFLVVLSVVATRGLWGSGLLQGGGLLPAPDRPGTWWTLYLDARHAVSTGSDQPTGPYVVVLAGLGVATFGHPWLVVDVLMLLAVPLAAVGGYAAARTFVSSVPVRIFMAVSYGLLPVVSGAVGAGRLGTVVTAIGLPWLVVAGRPLFQGSGRWRSVATTGVVLSVLVAFTPVGWLLVIPVGVVVAARWVLLGSVRSALLVVVAALIPAVTLLPWSLALLAHPRRFLVEAGAVDVTGRLHPVSGWYWPLTRVGAPGAAPAWIGIGVLVAALAVLTRADRRRKLAVCWWVAALGLVGALVMSRGTVTATSGASVPVWLGVPVVVAAAGLVAAVGVGADGAVGAVTAEVFGWRQMLAPLVVVVALVTPLAGLVWWVVSAPHGALHRSPAVSLPGYVQQVMADGSSTLVLSPDPPGLTYDVVTGDGTRLGDDSVLTNSAVALRPLVSDLAAGQRTDVATRLAHDRVQYVTVRRPVPGALLDALDGVPGLARTGSDSARFSIWQVTASGPPVRAGARTTSRDRWLLAEAGALVVLLVVMGPGIRRHDRAGAAA
jgi:GT2 family glycosyltransferase